MARIPILRFGSLAGQARQFHLVTNDPSINLDGLLRGVDNLRHDVYLSPSFCHTARQHVARRLAHHAGVLDLLHSDPRPRRLLAPQAPEAEDKHNPAKAARSPWSSTPRSRTPTPAACTP